MAAHIVKDLSQIAVGKAVLLLVPKRDNDLSYSGLIIIFAGFETMFNVCWGETSHGKSQTNVDHNEAKTKAQSCQADVEGPTSCISSICSGVCPQNLLSQRRPNVFINNAGVMACQLESIVDGLENQVGPAFPFLFRFLPYQHSRNSKRTIRAHQAAAACAAVYRSPGQVDARGESLLYRSDTLRQ